MNTAEPESISVFCLTPGGVVLASKIRQFLPMAGYCAKKYVISGFQPFDGSFAHTVASRFRQDSALIVIGAVGIVVRVIAPLLLDKYQDPAVIVIDEKGTNVISLLSGHLGGANALTHYLAGVLGANAVVTTSTDVNDKCSLDLLIRQLSGWCYDSRSAVKTVNQLLVSNRHVGVFVDPEFVRHAAFDLANVDTRGMIHLEHLSAKPVDLAALVYISIYRAELYWQIPVIKLVPRRVVLGIGCRKHTPPDVLSSVVAEQLGALNIDPHAVAMIGSIDVKKDEAAILALAKEYDVPFELFTTAELSKYEHLFESSKFVAQTVGVGAVSQPVAWLLSHGNLIGETYRARGITLTIGVMH